VIRLAVFLDCDEPIQCFDAVYMGWLEGHLALITLPFVPKDSVPDRGVVLKKEVEGHLKQDLDKDL